MQSILETLRSSRVAKVYVYAGSGRSAASSCRGNRERSGHGQNSRKKTEEKQQIWSNNARNQRKLPKRAFSHLFQTATGQRCGGAQS